MVTNSEKNRKGRIQKESSWLPDSALSSLDPRAYDRAPYSFHTCLNKNRVLSRHSSHTSSRYQV